MAYQITEVARGAQLPKAFFVADLSGRGHANTFMADEIPNVFADELADEALEDEQPLADYFDFAEVGQQYTEFNNLAITRIQ